MISERQISSDIMDLLSHSDNRMVAGNTTTNMIASSKKRISHSTADGAHVIANLARKTRLSSKCLYRNTVSLGTFSTYYTSTSLFFVTDAMLILK